MTTLSAKDVRERPGEFFLVVRSARGHAHVPVDEFDGVLEGIGQSADTATRDRITALEQRLASLPPPVPALPSAGSDEDLMRIIQALVQKIDAMDAEISLLKGDLDAIKTCVVPASIEQIKGDAA